MLECLVFGRRAAKNISRELSLHTNSGFTVPVPDFPSRPSSPTDYNELRSHIQQLMNDYCCVLRTTAGMEKALNEMTDILSIMEGEFTESREYLETLNIATIAKAILEAALARKESVGAHFRED
jgi:L-aspartate oxidase